MNETDNKIIDKIFFASMAISTERIFRTPGTRNAWQNRNGKVVE
jgi:hypothetical protein